MYDRISILLKLWEERFPERKLGGDSLAQGQQNLKPFLTASDETIAHEQDWRMSIGVRKRLTKPAAAHLKRYIHAILSDLELGASDSELLRPLDLKMEIEKKRSGRTRTDSSEPEPPTPPLAEEPPANTTPPTAAT